jgi:hypothetical protein
MQYASYHGQVASRAQGQSRPICGSESVDVIGRSNYFSVFSLKIPESSRDTILPIMKAELM